MLDIEIPGWVRLSFNFPQRKPGLDGHIIVVKKTVGRDMIVEAVVQLEIDDHFSLVIVQQHIDILKLVCYQ